MKYIVTKWFDNPPMVQKAVPDKLQDGVYITDEGSLWRDKQLFDTPEEAIQDYELKVLRRHRKELYEIISLREEA
jgi:hypothetical protein